MNIETNSIIGQIVAGNYRYAGVFQSAGIDFCCQGNKTIGEACTERKIDVDSFIDKLNAIPDHPDDHFIDFRSWPLDLIIDFIEKKHHRFVRDMIEEIMPYLDKVSRVHGGRHPELHEIYSLFSQSANELTGHMRKEEMVLFPFIIKLTQATGQINAPFGSVNNPINMMRHEHDAEGERFRMIARLSDNYTPPGDACNTYRVVFALLKDFEDDLHKHIHLENNILFPRAIELERNRNPAAISE